MRLIKDNVERIAEGEAQIQKLKAAGFKAAGQEPVSTGGNDGGKSIDKMSATELKTLAKEKGIEGAGSLTKDELLLVLKDVTSDD